MDEADDETTFVAWLGDQGVAAHEEQDYIHATSPQESHIVHGLWNVQGWWSPCYSAGRQDGGKDAKLFTETRFSTSQYPPLQDTPSSSLSARDTWNALCKCWIYVYQGPPDIITHDPGTNFASEEFRNNAQIIGVSCKEMPVEAHWAVGKVDRAHRPLKRAYEILKEEIGHCTDPDTILQMAVKVLNDTAGPNGLVPTLFVFGAYPRVTTDSPPSPDITKRAEAVRKAIKMLREIRSKVDIDRAINTRNGPTSQEYHNHSTIGKSTQQRPAYIHLVLPPPFVGLNDWTIMPRRTTRTRNS
ncbi:hypothetical protein F4779DRAFT_620271 [Xylariaceae sp. FL0662B]|nr:hypothetical protein F4779DRAFT_620271 [Xylariaceae sp. FL0662B]